MNNILFEIQLGQRVECAFEAWGAGQTPDNASNKVFTRDLFGSD